MDYRVESIIEFSETYETLISRLSMWAERYRFKLIEEQEGKLIYNRGSHFRASCSFDVRYVPTTVKIEFLKVENKIMLEFHVKSHFYRAFPSDPDRVNEQMELLIAYLRGSFDKNLDYKVKI